MSGTATQRETRVAISVVQTASHPDKESALKALESIPKPNDSHSGYDYEASVTSRKVATGEGDKTKDEFRAFWKPVASTVQGLQKLLEIDPVGVLEDFNSGRNTRYNNLVGAAILGEHMDPAKAQAKAVKAILALRKLYNMPISEDEAQRIVEQMKPRQRKGNKAA